MPRKSRANPPSPFKGFSSSQPMDRNDTEAGREANRRVEFVVDLKILNDGSGK